MGIIIYIHYWPPDPWTPSLDGSSELPLGLRNYSLTTYIWLAYLLRRLEHCYVSKSINQALSIKTNMHQTLCQGLYRLVSVGGSTNQVLPYLMSLLYAHKFLHSPHSKGKGSNTTSTNTHSFRGMDLTTRLVMRKYLVKVSVIYHIQLIQLENHKNNLLVGMCRKKRVIGTDPTSSLGTICSWH